MIESKKPLGGNAGRALLVVVGVLVLIAAVFALVLWLAGGDDHGKQNAAPLVNVLATAEYGLFSRF